MKRSRRISGGIYEKVILSVREPSGFPAQQEVEMGRKRTVGRFLPPKSDVMFTRYIIFGIRRAGYIRINLRYILLS